MAAQLASPGRRLTITIVSIVPILCGCGVEGPNELPYPHGGEDDGSAPADGEDETGQGAGSTGTTGAGLSLIHI